MLAGLLTRDACGREKEAERQRQHRVTLQDIVRDGEVEVECVKTNLAAFFTASENGAPLLGHMSAKIER